MDGTPISWRPPWRRPRKPRARSASSSQRAGRGRSDDGEAAFLLYIRRELLEQILVSGAGLDVSLGEHLAGIDVLRAAFLGIVAAELNDDIVARLEGIEHLIPAALLEKALERFARLGVIGDGDSGLNQRVNSCPQLPPPG